MPDIHLKSPPWFKPSMVREPIDPDKMVGLEGPLKKRLIRWLGKRVSFEWTPAVEDRGRKLQAEGYLFFKVFYCERANMRGEGVLLQGLPGTYGWTSPE